MASSLVEASHPVDEKSLQDLSPHYTPQHSRLISLDVIKGIAVLAGLFFAIFAWAGISRGMQGAVLQQRHGSTHVLQVLVSLLFEDKMRTLLVLAFGASMLLVLVRQHPGSRFSNQELLIRRNFTLLVFGIINGILFLWPYDILYGLGIVGVIFFAFTRMGARGLYIAALLTVLIGCGKIYWNYNDDQKAYKKFLVVETKEKKIKADSVKLKDSLKTGFKKTDTLTWKQKEEKGAWEGISKKFKWEKKNDSGQIKALQDGRYTKVYDQQLGTTQQRESMWFFQFGFWQFAAALLLGMALFKSGFFNGKFTVTQHLIIFLVTLFAGFFLFRVRMHGWDDSIKDYTLYVKTRPLPGDLFKPLEILLMALAYASLVMIFIQKEWLSPVTRLLSTVGRMALSNYLLQSILLGTLFYGYGMGYYARIPQNWLYFIVLEMIIIQIVFSVFWLRYYYVGPAEWLVTSVSKGRKQPFRIKPADQTGPSQDLQTI